MRRSPSCRPQRRIPSCRLQSSTPRQIRQGRFGEDVAGSSTIWSMLESSKWYLSGVQLRFPHVSNHSVFCCSFRCACAGTPYRNSKNLQHMGVSRNSWCPNLDENVKQYLHICYDMILRDIILCERDVGESHVCMHVHSNMYILLTCMAQDRHWCVKVMALAALACRRGWPLSSTSPEEQYKYQELTRNRGQSVRRLSAVLPLEPAPWEKNDCWNWIQSSSQRKMHSSSDTRLATTLSQ